jgi:hypothetical protein
MLRPALVAFGAIVWASLAVLLAPIVFASPPPDYHARPEFFASNRTVGKGQQWDNEWEYVDLAFKIDYSALEGPGQHVLNGIFLGHTIARETFATQFILDVHRAVNVSTNRLFVHNVTPAAHHFEHAARYVMVNFRLYHVTNVTGADDDAYEFAGAGGRPGARTPGFAARELNPAYSRGGGYHEDNEASNDIKWAEDATWRLGNSGDLSTVEALAELSDQVRVLD